MPEPRAPRQRVLAAGAAIVLLVVGAGSVCLWRAEASSRLANTAILDHRQLAAVATGNDLLVERGAVLESNRRVSAAQRLHLLKLQAKFIEAVTAHDVIAQSLSSVERRMIVRIMAANTRLVDLEETGQPWLGTRGATAALLQLRRRQDALNRALDPFIDFNAREAGDAYRASRSAHHEFRLVALIAIPLVLTLALLLVGYILRLLGLFFARVRADSELLEQRLHEVEEARLETLQRLALGAEYRDDDTLQHTERVGRLSALIAARMGIAAESVELLRLAAPLHDIGKLGISDTILLKPGRLAPAEREQMQRHTTIGASILAGSKYPVLRLAEQIALAHHERWDGTGYPVQLAGQQIHIAARIVALADVFDALTHERPYKHAWPLYEAIAEIRCLSGKHFDPRVVDAFLSIDHETIAELTTAPPATTRVQEQMATLTAVA